MLESRRWAVIGLALVVLSVRAILTAGLPPLRPEEVRENRQALWELSVCYADYHGVELQVVHFPKPPNISPCEDTGWVGIACLPGDTLQAIGWAMPRGHSVSYWDTWVRGDFAGSRTLAHVAAHEVCHVTGMWDETATESCARRTVRQTDCSEMHDGDRMPREETPHVQ